MIGVQSTWAGFWRRRSARGRGQGALADVRVNGPESNTPLLTAIGTGGRIVLMRDHIVLTKNHFLGDLINILGLGYGKVQKTIMIDDISSVSIIRPMLFPDFIVFTYPGSSSVTGNTFTDALKENALIMNLFDNRAFYELKERIQSMHPTRNSAYAPPRR